MNWTPLHATLLFQAFEHILGESDQGAMAFVRCLSPEVVERLAAERQGAPAGWRVCRVADREDLEARTITADQAVEMRESKAEAVLLLVDTRRAGAGMDGIYSAAREIDEAGLFKEALRLAAHQVTNHLGGTRRKYAKRAISRSRGAGQRYSISPWTQFDYLVRVASEQRHPGELVWLLGLWPIQHDDGTDPAVELGLSRSFVQRLLGNLSTGLTPAQRIESLRLLEPTEQQLLELERFLRSATTQPLLASMEALADKPYLWINTLTLEGAAQAIQKIEIVPWRTRTGKLAKWSGLTGGAEDDPPVLILDPEYDTNGNYSRLEIRWKARPDNLEKDAVQYRVAIVTDMDEALTWHEVSHSGKREEKCRFTDDDFSLLSENARLSAKIVISVLGNESLDEQESEEFDLYFGTPPDRGASGVGRVMRSFSEGLIELDDRDLVTSLAAATSSSSTPKGYLVLRTPQRGKSYRVFRPPLIHEIEQEWGVRDGEIGRWRVRVRVSGSRAGAPEFVAITGSNTWDRTVNASRRMAKRFGECGGGVGQIYDQKSKAFGTVVKEYLLAWEATLNGAEPTLALANTVEVQSLSGRTIGLIVLPSHPLRVAWHVAYDNLVFHTHFEQGMAPKQVRDEFALLDGAMFPAFLPGLKPGSSFVFADTLGFHAVGMVPEDDREPKAAVAILARALGESEAADTAPTVGQQSAQVLGDEILKYIECHDTSRLLRIHALRPGDGLTIARSLGHVLNRSRQLSHDEDLEEGAQPTVPSFVLELYPSEGQRGVAGRFIAEAREKRRSGAGVLLENDRWMLESSSLPGGMTLPRLRWARKPKPIPETAAHLAVAFDTFESRVVPGSSDDSTGQKPYFAFGLMTFFERNYSSDPSPHWKSAIIGPTEGEKHPADRTHTERLVRLQQAIQRCVARGPNVDTDVPVLLSEISPEKGQNLRDLHRLCDWVITLDRNAGVEYFDSPRDNRDVYDAYVIDCVPEREDLGCLQLITSTSNLEEVRNLLDSSLDRMALSRSRRNAEFLLEHLKALSGRLAIRLTGQKPPTAELIALSMCHANCRQASDDDPCWASLRSGFFVPVDDIRDLLPPLADKSDNVEKRGQDDSDHSDERATRPDLIHVSIVPHKGLLFRFTEVKYRRYLRTARTPETLLSIQKQVESLHKRWYAWYGCDDVCAPFRAVRRAKLARVLRFYADKARRHATEDDATGLSKNAYDELVAEIDRLIEKGGDYAFASVESSDRGWLFCPEYAGTHPLEITPDGWQTRIFLFGPDSNFRRDDAGLPPAGDAPAAAPYEPPRKNDEHPSTRSSSEQGTPATPQGVRKTRTGGAGTETTDVGVTPAGDGDLLSDDAALLHELIESTPAICLGTNPFTEADVQWPLSVRGNPHLLIAGLPGMGKTTCLLNLCRQMLGWGIRPILFSYHQDIDEKLQHIVEEVRFVDFDGLGFNPLQVINRESRMAYLDVAGTLRDIFTAIYPELGDIQGERIRGAIKESFLELGWDDPPEDRSQLVEPPFSRFVEILRSLPKPDRGLKTLLSRLEELDDYGFFRAAEAQESLWKSEHPIVVRIHQTQNDKLQNAFASLVFYGLYKDMFRRGTRERITHALIFDEAHRAARLKLIPTMAKECRKYGISLVLASQEAHDFHTSLFSAIANYLVLRLTEVDARVLAKNVATSDQERALIDRVKQLERFKAFYCSEGQKKPVPVNLLRPNE